MLELNKIYNEDCLEGIKKIPTSSIDLVVIDPPYELSTRKKDESFNKNKITRDIYKLQEELIKGSLVNGYDYVILDELVRVMKTINIYIWCNKKQLLFYFDYFVKKLGCNYEVLLWNKTNVMPLYSNTYLSDKEYCLYFRKKGYCKPKNYSDARTVYFSTTNMSDKKRYGHPTIKPLEFIRKIIRNSSVEGDIVLDSFMGSGTTAVACILENRNYIGFEVNKKYYDIALKRIEETKKEMNNSEQR